MVFRLVCLLGFVAMIQSCNSQQSKTVTPVNESRSFEMVAVPAMISDPAERAEFLVKHYWDKFDFADTMLMHLPDVTEQALANYIDLMQHVSPQTQSVAMKNMMQKAAADSSMYAYFVDQYEKYLYDPNSPLRNEPLFAYVLESVLEQSVFDDTNKIRPAYLLEQISKNKVGDKAIDFTYTLASGKKGKLSQVSTDYVLLFFNNPDCHACREITEQIATSEAISSLIKQKKMTILAVYTDEDQDTWKKHVSEMPSEWINSYDENLILKNDELYDLKAIPTLYLIGKNKEVLLKDVTFSQLETFIQEQL